VGIDSTSDAASGKPTRKTAGNKEFIAMVTAFMAMGALAIDIMIPAFPEMRREFGMSPDSTDVGWIVTAVSPSVRGSTVRHLIASAARSPS
jgi:hypothetical protein